MVLAREGQGRASSTPPPHFPVSILADRKQIDSWGRVSLFPAPPPPHTPNSSPQGRVGGGGVGGSQLRGGHLTLEFRLGGIQYLTWLRVGCSDQNSPGKPRRFMGIGCIGQLGIVYIVLLML
jgi:hypothetical protein